MKFQTLAHVSLRLVRLLGADKGSLFEESISWNESLPSCDVFYTVWFWAHGAITPAIKLPIPFLSTICWLSNCWNMGHSCDTISIWTVNCFFERFLLFILIINFCERFFGLLSRKVCSDARLSLVISQSFSNCKTWWFIYCILSFNSLRFE